MAYIGLKQLDPVLTGSLQVSGSSGVTGSLDVSSTGSFGRVVATTFTGDGSNLTNVFEGTTPSASISTRLTTEEANVDTLFTRTLNNLNSITIATASIAGLVIDSGSFSTRITTAESELGNTLISSSAQLATDISGSWQGSIDISSDTNLVGGTNITLSGDTLNVDDAFLVNSGDDTTSGTITAGGFTTTATGSFGRLEADVLEAKL